MTFCFLLISLVISCTARNDNTSNNQVKINSMEDELMLVLRFETKEGKKELFKKELHSLLDKLAERPNFVSVTFLEDVDNPHAIMLYEIWGNESKENFMQKNFADPNFKIYQNNVKELLAKPPTAYFLNAYKEL